MADITKSPTFPDNAISQRAKRAHRGYAATNDETLFQIISLENCSRSAADQLDELLANEEVGGVGADRLRFGNNRVVRQMDVEDDNGNGQEPVVTSSINNATSLFKLTLQDGEGALFYAIELDKLNFLSSKNTKHGFPIPLGAKLLVKKGVEVSHNCLLLKPQDVSYLGGVVTEWNVDLVKKHIQHLRERLQQLP